MNSSGLYFWESSEPHDREKRLLGFAGETPADMPEKTEEEEIQDIAEALKKHEKADVLQSVVSKALKGNKLDAEGVERIASRFDTALWNQGKGEKLPDHMRNKTYLEKIAKKAGFIDESLKIRDVSRTAELIGALSRLRAVNEANAEVERFLREGADAAGAKELAFVLNGNFLPEDKIPDDIKPSDLKELLAKAGFNTMKRGPNYEGAAIKVVGSQFYVVGRFLRGGVEVDTAIGDVVADGVDPVQAYHIRTALLNFMAKYNKKNPLYQIACKKLAQVEPIFKERSLTDLSVHARVTFEPWKRHYMDPDTKQAVEEMMKIRGVKIVMENDKPVAYPDETSADPWGTKRRGEYGAEPPPASSYVSTRISDMQDARFQRIIDAGNAQRQEQKEITEIRRGVRGHSPALDARYEKRDGNYKYEKSLREKTQKLRELESLTKNPAAGVNRGVLAQAQDHLNTMRIDWANMPPDTKSDQLETFQGMLDSALPSAESKRDVKEDPEVGRQAKEVLRRTKAGLEQYLGLHPVDEEAKTTLEGVTYVPGRWDSMDPKERAARVRATENALPYYGSKGWIGPSETMAGKPGSFSKEKEIDMSSLDRKTAKERSDMFFAIPRDYPADDRQFTKDVQEKIQRVRTLHSGLANLSKPGSFEKLSPGEQVLKLRELSRKRKELKSVLAAVEIHAKEVVKSLAQATFDDDGRLSFDSMTDVKVTLDGAEFSPDMKPFALPSLGVSCRMDPRGKAVVMLESPTFTQPLNFSVQGRTVTVNIRQEDIDNFKKRSGH